MADPAKTGVITDTKEKWMNAEYTIKRIDKSHFADWVNATPIPSIQLPPQNPYLPKQLALISSNPEHTQDDPLLLASDKGFSIYYAQDTRYKVPEIAFLFSFKSPLINTSARAQVLSDIYVRALTEKLAADLSLASSAGLSARFYTDDLDLKMSLYGYNDKARLLLNKIFSSFKNVDPTKEEFEIYRTSLASDYDNASKELPVRQAMQQ